MPLWHPADAHRLRHLRLSQNLGTLVLAQRCAISERQLLELEGFGEASFYSEAIKYQTGLKVLRFLGDDATDKVHRAAQPLLRRSSTAVTIPPLHVAPPSENHKLLRGIGLALAVSGALVSFTNVLYGLGLRPGGVLLIVTGLGMVGLVARGRNWWAVMLLTWGCLLINFSSAMVAKGLANVSWVAIPIGIMAAGWFLGKAMAWTVAAVSSLGTLAIYALHLKGYPFATDLPLETMLAGLLVSFSVAALIGGATSETYGRQFELISESRAELHAVMDSTRAMIWSVSAKDLTLRTFNRAIEQALLDHTDIQLSPGLLPDQMFGTAELGQHWTAAYNRALANEGLALEASILGDERMFEISFQPIRRDQKLIGLSVHALDITGRHEAAQRARA